MSATGPRRDIVVIGASAGGVGALRKLAADLPAAFPAAVLVVLHVGAHASLLPELLEAAGPNSASHAQDGEELRTGHLAVAPPDRHLLLDGNTLRLNRGPKEHFTRPAIDCLFRSAAFEQGARVIGVVLTGDLDDGTAGLQAIKRCGGLVIVQDPRTALAHSMPASAVAYVDVDFVLPLEAIAAKLHELIRQPAPAPAPAPDASARAKLKHEQAPLTGTVNTMEDLQAIATPSPLVCPECGGGLWEVKESRPARFRCHTGHGFSLRTLEYSMNLATEDAVWAAARALQERAVVTQRIASEDRRVGHLDAAEDADARAKEDEERAALLRQVIDGL